MARRLLFSEEMAQLYVIVCWTLAGALAAQLGWGQLHQCTNETRCSSEDGVGVCEEGMCACVLASDPSRNLTRCFHLTNSSEGFETCVKTQTSSLCEYHAWSGPNHDCCFTYRDSNCIEGRYSRLIAILLSVFLINFGAGNFYIERYDLAIPQLLIGLLACVFQIGACSERCVNHDEDEGKPTKCCFFCCGFNAFFSCLLFAWWLADVFIFAFNLRTDGRGCRLYE